MTFRVFLSQCTFGLHLQRGERRAKLMCCIRDEALLSGLAFGDLADQAVHRGYQRPDFRRRALDVPQRGETLRLVTAKPRRDLVKAPETRSYCEPDERAGDEQHRRLQRHENQNDLARERLPLPLGLPDLDRRGSRWIGGGYRPQDDG